MISKNNLFANNNYLLTNVLNLMMNMFSNQSENYMKLNFWNQNSRKNDYLHFKIDKTFLSLRVEKS